MSTMKQRHTRARRDRARKMFALKSKNLSKCPHCGAMIRPHAVCPKCGYYKDREVINTAKKIAKKKK